MGVPLLGGAGFTGAPSLREAFTGTVQENPGVRLGLGPDGYSKLLEDQAQWDQLGQALTNAGLGVDSDKKGPIAQREEFLAGIQAKSGMSNEEFGLVLRAEAVYRAAVEQGNVTLRTSPLMALTLSLEAGSSGGSSPEIKGLRVGR